MNTDINITAQTITATAFEADQVTLRDDTYAVVIEFVGTTDGANFASVTDAPQYRVTDTTGGDRDAAELLEALDIAAEFIDDVVEPDAANATDWAETATALRNLFR